MVEVGRPSVRSLPPRCPEARQCFSEQKGSADAAAPFYCDAEREVSAGCHGGERGWQARAYACPKTGDRSRLPIPQGSRCEEPFTIAIARAMAQARMNAGHYTLSISTLVPYKEPPEPSLPNAPTHPFRQLPEVINLRRNTLFWRRMRVDLHRLTRSVLDRP